MKALTLHQPYATAIALGIKTMETRSWRTTHRGPLAIHAAKSLPAYARAFAGTEVALGRIPSRLPLGAVVAIAQLVDIRPTAWAETTALERIYGDFTPGRWAWILEDVHVFDEPIPARGAQRLWEWDEHADRLAAARARWDQEYSTMAQPGGSADAMG